MWLREYELRRLVITLLMSNEELEGEAPGEDILSVGLLPLL